MHDAAFKLPVFADAKLASVRPAAAKGFLETTAGLAGLAVGALAAGVIVGFAAAKKL